VGVATTQTAERLLAAGAQLVIDDFNDPALWALIESMQ
jgi:phage tail sheath protein FI